MFESIKWPFKVKIILTDRNQFPSVLSKCIAIMLKSVPITDLILPFLHKTMTWQAVYEFSKVGKKIVANQQNSCKGSQCNRVDPITNPLNSGVTL